MTEKKIELICLDLDGTLFNSKHQMSEDAIAVLHKLEDQGVKIAVVTGRGAFEAKKYAKRLSDNAYYIGSNGAVAGTVKGDGPIAESALTRRHMDGLMAFAYDNHLYPILQGKEHQYISGFFDYILHIYFTKIRQRESIESMVFMPMRKKLKKKLHDQRISIYKAVLFIKNPQKAQKIEGQLREHPEFELAITNNFCFEITEKGMNKSRGIQALAIHLGIDKSRIMAFGDSENDKEMLKYVGYGIAMGNATDALKSVADYVTDTNDNEGISKVLNEVLNNRFELTL